MCNYATMQINLHYSAYYRKPLVCLPCTIKNNRNIGYKSVTKNQKDVGKVTYNGNDASEKHVLKDFEILLSKPINYSDIAHFRQMSKGVLSNITLFKSSELCSMVEIFSRFKYRNLILMQGICEALFWSCKLRSVKLSDITIFLRSCALLRYVPNFRYLRIYLKELDNIRYKASVGDNIRILQFLVQSNLSHMDLFVDFYNRTYNHCKNSLGLMSHRQLASFGLIQIHIDKTNQEVFDKICLNFHRELSQSGSNTFYLLSSAILISSIGEIPPDYPELLKYYLSERSDDMTPKMLNTSLSILSKFHYRDTECLNKLGLCIKKQISSYSHRDISSALNQFSSLSYKHKILVSYVSKSNFLESSDLNNRMNVIFSSCNLLSKVKYLPVDYIKSLCSSSINCIEKVAYNHRKSDDRTCGLYKDEINGDKSAGSKLHLKNQNAFNDSSDIITADMILETFLPKSGENILNNRKSRTPKKSSRRLLYNITENNDHGSAKISDSLSLLRAIPQSADILRAQSLTECVEAFMKKHFNGLHPARKRLGMRKKMLRQYSSFEKKPLFENSASSDSVHLETFYKGNFNTSIKKIKKKMRYSGSRYVQPTSFFINECKILKRCFLSPFKSICKYDLNDYGKYLISTSHYSNLLMLSYFLKTVGTRSSLLPRDPYCDNVADFSMNGTGKHILDIPESLKQDLEVSEPCILDQFVVNSSVYVDNKFLIPPITTNSLLSKRTKNLYHKIKRDHNSSRMDHLIQYNIEHRIWEKIQPKTYESGTDYKNDLLQLFVYSSGIISSLNRLNFVSLNLINVVSEKIIPQVLKCLSSVKDSTLGHATYKRPERDRVQSFIRSLVYILESTKPLIIEDKSNNLTKSFIGLLCSNDFITVLDMYSSRIHEDMLGKDILGLMHSFNTLTFVWFNKMVKSMDTTDSSLLEIGEFPVITEFFNKICRLVGDPISRGMADSSISVMDLTSKMTKLLNNLTYNLWFVTNVHIGSLADNRNLQNNENLDYTFHLASDVGSIIMSRLNEFDFDTNLVQYSVCTLVRHFMSQQRIRKLINKDIDAGNNIVFDSNDIPRIELDPNMSGILTKYCITNKMIEGAITHSHNLNKRDNLQNFVTLMKSEGGPSSISPIIYMSDRSNTLLYQFFTNHFIAP